MLVHVSVPLATVILKILLHASCTCVTNFEEKLRTIILLGTSCSQMAND